MHLWRTPAGYWFQVDHRGTHHLGRDRDPTLPDRPQGHAHAHDGPDSATPGTEADTCWPLADRSPLERRLADTLGWS